MSEVPAYPSAKLVAYDEVWPEMYAALAEPLRVGLGATWQVEHIGSTSVPGLIAKPVIDLAVRIPKGERIGDHVATLNQLGWTEFTDLGTHHVLFRIDASGVRRAIAHFFDDQQWPHAHQRLFSTWLRAHPEDRDAYGALKVELIGAGLWGHDYTAAKRVFIQEVVNRARAELGLAPLCIWPRPSPHAPPRSRFPARRCVVVANQGTSPPSPRPDAAASGRHSEPVKPRCQLGYGAHSVCRHMAWGPSGA